MLPSIPLKYVLPLCGLTVSAFVFNTSEFMPIALLTDISKSFDMTPAATGIMITVYAWIVGVLSLPLMLAVSRMNPKRLLLMTLALFACGQVGSGLAISFPMLMCSRVAVAAAHAIFWSIAAPLATRLVTRKHQSFSLSMVATGSSIAMIFGLPIGRIIGLALGWRMTFLIIAVITLIVLLYLWRVFPDLASGKPFTLNELPSLLKSPVVFGVLIMTLLFATAYFTTYSYIEPYLAQVAAFAPSSITCTLMILGICGFFGTVLFSRLYGPHRYGVIRVGVLGLVVPLALFLPASVWGPAMILTCMVLGTISTLFNVSMQAELIRNCSLAAAPVAMSIFSGIFNVGIGSGTFIGGYVTANDCLPYIGFVGAFIAACGAIYCLVRYLPAIRKIAQAKQKKHTTASRD